MALWTVKLRKENGSEDFVYESNNETLSYQFPKNTGDVDLTYAIYYDKGNGCVASDTIVVKAGDSCKPIGPDNPPVEEDCVIYYKSNTSAPTDVTITITDEDNNVVFTTAYTNSTPTAFEDAPIDAQYKDKTLYMQVSFPEWSTNYDTKQKVECGKKYEIIASKTVYVVGRVETLSNGKGRVGKFEMHKTFDENESYSPSYVWPESDYFYPPRGSISLKFSAYKVKNNSGSNTPYYNTYFGTDDYESTGTLVESDCVLDYTCWISYNDAICGSAEGGGTQFITSQTDPSFIVSSDTVKQKVQQGKKLLDVNNNITYLLRVQCPF